MRAFKEHVVHPVHLFLKDDPPTPPPTHTTLKTQLMYLSKSFMKGVTLHTATGAKTSFG